MVDKGGRSKITRDGLSKQVKEEPDVDPITSLNNAFLNEENTTYTISSMRRFLRNPAGRELFLPFTRMALIEVSTEIPVFVPFTDPLFNLFHDPKINPFTGVDPPLSVPRLTIAATLSLNKDSILDRSIRVFGTSLFSPYRDFVAFRPSLDVGISSELSESYEVAIAEFCAFIFPDNPPILYLDEILKQCLSEFRAHCPQDLHRVRGLIPALERRCSVLTAFFLKSRGFMVEWESAAANGDSEGWTATKVRRVS